MKTVVNILACLLIIFGCNPEKPIQATNQSHNQQTPNTNSMVTAFNNKRENLTFGMQKLAVHIISWEDFSHYVQLPCERTSDDQIICPLDEVDKRLPDNDHIWLKEEDGSSHGLNPSEVEIVLSSSTQVRYWKEIKAFSNDGQELGWIQTQDDAHGPVLMKLNAESVGSLVFSKGKQFNIHTGMYQVFDVISKKGKRLSFEWRVD